MIFGVDYYPEHWPQERWLEDARLMTQLGLQLVRLAEFSWTLLEPREGAYSFQWLDTAIEILTGEGLSVILCTPTAVPPQWLIQKYPDLLPVNREGLTIGPGSRRHYCVNHPTLHAYTEAVVRAMGAHYRGEEGVVGWQIDNEFSCHHTARCYCTHCRTAFQEYLKERYGSLTALNAAWGTVFWNMTFTHWDEIFLPRLAVTEHNPSLLLDFYRFSSESNRQYMELQLDILRSLKKEWFITHNLMGTRVNELEAFQLGGGLDFISWDNYNEEGRAPFLTSMDHDLMRSLKKKPFWVMEQQVGQINWGETNPLPRPGAVELWSKQAISRGCRGMVFFRWRASPFGQEEFHSGLLRHDASPSRGFWEVKRCIPPLRNLSEILDESRPLAEVGILFSYEQQWALEIQPYNTSFQYLEYIKAYYRALWEKNVGVDFLTASDDLSDYHVIIAPTLFLTEEQLVERLSSFVEAGGTLILTLRSGMKDMANRVLEEPFPGPFREMAGMQVVEYDSLPSTMQNRVVMDWSDEQKSYQAHTWCEILQQTGARILGRYQEDFYRGEGAVTINPWGKGQVLYVGAMMEEAFYQDLISWLLGTVPLTAPLPSPSGVELVQQVDSLGNISLCFLLNHNQEQVEITLPGEWMDLEKNAPILGRRILRPLEGLILRPIQ